MSDQGIDLVDRIVAIHRSLASAHIPHAFGGALALAWCTERARATIDIDLNVFVAHDDADPALDALPPGVEVGDAERAAIATEGQTRLWWDGVPVDVFFDTSPFHAEAARRARVERFGDADAVPFLACRDLAVFKAFFDRTKDWADLEEMASAGTLDVPAVVAELVRHLGADDPRVVRLLSL